MPVFSAGIVPVDIDGPEPRFLMLRSRKYWDFPKGKLDPGESFLEAALRETEEESSIYDLDFKWGTPYIETEPYKTKVLGKTKKKVARYYIASVVSGKPEIRPNQETGILEHEEFRWLTYQESADVPLQPRMRKILEWANNIVEGNDVDSVREKRKDHVTVDS